MVIAPLGVSAATDAAKEIAGVPASLVRAALGAEPWPVGRIAGAPVFSAVPLPAPWAGFLPCFDLAPARAVARLIGAPPIPAPPFSRHNDSRPWSKP
jgi:tRNA(Ile)-lysidine synthase